jgi:RNA polymerase sigma-70 factor (ECF subfamily)
LLDISIIEGCVKKDRISQKKLYESYYSFGMSISTRYATNKEEAEWLLNEAFFKIFDNISTFDTTKDFKPWFKVILINTILNWNKKNKNEFDNLNYIEVLINVKDESENIFDKLNYEDIVKEIQFMSPAYRLVLNLYLIEGYQHNEIAEKLGISEGTSKSNLHKAKAILKNKLKEKINFV